MVKKSGLGKGIGALLDSSGEKTSSKYFVCPIEDLKPGKQQPRKSFDEEKLQELSASIREKGVLQPIIVRRSDSYFEIIAGERRWRAAQKAGLREVPVIIETMAEDAALEVALIENLQREDLNPLEEAEAYQALIDHFGFSQEEVGQKVGKDRSTITNSLRLLKLPADTRQDVVSGRLSMGHARALLSLETEEDMLEARDEIVRKGMSVRDAEDLVKKMKKKMVGLSRKKEKTQDPEILDITDRLQQVLGTQVKMSGSGKGGKIEIKYYSTEDLERLLGLMGM